MNLFVEGFFAMQWSKGLKKRISWVSQVGLDFNNCLYKRKKTQRSQERCEDGSRDWNYADQPTNA